MDRCAESRMRALATELLEVAGGDGALERGEAIVDRDVVMHLDALTFRGRDRWRGFVRYLRHRRRRAGLRIRIDDARVDGDRVTVHARLGGGEAGREWPVVASFRVRDGCVVELWTRRSNYTAVLGDAFATRFGLAVGLLRAAWWCRTHGEG